MDKKFGQGLPPLIWTKSKRTATFFGRPSLTLRHILQGINIKSGKGIMMSVEGPAAVDTRESCRQVHQVKGSVSGDVISNSLIQPEILCLLI